MSDSIRQNDEILVGVENLSLAEQHAGEMIIDQAVAGAAGAVQYQYRVVDLAVRVAVRFAVGHVMQPQFGQRLARGKVKIPNDKVAFDGRRQGGGGWVGMRRAHHEHQCGAGCEAEE